MTTLENSYCVPKTEKDWRLIAGNDMTHPDNKKYFPFIKHWQWRGDTPYPIGRGNKMTMGTKKDMEGLQEIPVQHFLDLVEDKITPWRLEEAGFSKLIDGYQSIELGDCSIYVFAGTISFKIYVMPTSEFAEDIRAYITTFTDLLTLIKFLTPPTK